MKPIQELIDLVDTTDFESDDIDIAKFERINSTSVYNLDKLAEKYIHLVNIIQNKSDKVHDLRYKSEHDELTGCYNRVKLDSMIKKYESMYSITVIFFDVNNLKLMNDTFGHDAGDALIKRAVNQLSYWNTYGDLYRMGGDEFMVVIPDKGDIEISELVNRWYLRQHRLNRDEDDFECKFSYGIAQGYKDNVFDFEMVMHLADSRMYEMKTQTKGAGR
jgi:diguanylate cyclase (GGDEF)-like protein